MVIDGAEGTSTPAFRSCGTRIDAVPIDEAVRSIIAGDVTGSIHLCNAYTLSLASKDAELAAVLEEGALNLPDGMPLIWIAKRLGFEQMTERVYGPDLMERVLDRGQPTGLRHYFYGSTDEVLASLRQSVETRWSAAEIVGWDSPPFSDDAVVSDESFEKIESSGAQVVWVGLGTPKQDFVAQHLAERSDLTIVAVGAAFDFIAGTKKQAPKWVQNAGVEWAYRFATEPRRLWKRYLIGNARFVAGNVRTRPSKLDVVSSEMSPS